MISKKLLSVIEGFKIDTIYTKTSELPENGILRFATEIKIGYKGGSRVGSCNIYELAHKCKEWAWENNYSLQTMKEISEENNGEWFIDIWNFKMLSEYETYGITEAEAIFKACEWILKEKL